MIFDIKTLFQLGVCIIIIRYASLWSLLAISLLLWIYFRKIKAIWYIFLYHEPFRFFCPSKQRWISKLTSNHCAIDTHCTLSCEILIYKDYFVKFGQNTFINVLLPQIFIQQFSVTHINAFQFKLNVLPTTHYYKKYNYILPSELSSSCIIILLLLLP